MNFRSRQDHPVSWRKHRPVVTTWLLTALLVAVLLVTGAQAQTATQTPPAPNQTSSFDTDVQLKSFDQVWERVRQAHWDPDLVGESWDKARDELRHRIGAANDIDEVREILNQLIGRLGQSHYSIIPQDAYDLLQFKGGSWDAGIRVRSSGDEMIVAQVRPESPAAKAGIKPGWTIQKIGKNDSDDIMDKIRKSSHGPARFETTVGLIGSKLTSGAPNSRIEFGFRDHQNESRQIELALEPTPGKLAQLGNLPPIRVAQRAETLNSNVGYYWFNAFLDPVRVMPKFRSTVRDPQHNGGIVIDLRGNMGGIAGMTMGMANLFATEKKSLGTMNMKGTKLKFAVTPGVRPIQVPVAILVDECSISSAEILAGGMQDLSMARIFGNRTAGLALPSVVSKLANGDGFQYAIADYHSANGQSLEANGVVPDEIVELTPEALSVDPDPVLTRALEWIEQSKTKQK